MARRSPTLKARDLADERVKFRYKGQPCAICGKPGAGHHLIPKGRCGVHRHNICNLIPLCQAHHMLGSDLAAHSTSSLVVERFCKWMRKNRPWQWAWVKEHEHDGATKHANRKHYEKMIQWWDDLDDSGKLIEEALADELEADRSSPAQEDTK